MTDCSQLSDQKPKIHLSLGQVGVIIPFPSGVIYQNQTCNVACAQRCEEGVLLLPTDPVLVEGPLIEVYQCPIEYALRRMDWGPVLGIDEKRASEIDDLFSSHGFTKYMAVDRSRLSDSEEAWVYIDISGEDEWGLYTGFSPCKGVLVWNNSD